MQSLPVFCGTVCNSERLETASWEDLEGAGGAGGGRGDRDGEDMWSQGLFISMYDKIHYK